MRSKVISVLSSKVFYITLMLVGVVLMLVANAGLIYKNWKLENENLMLRHQNLTVQMVDRIAIDQREEPCETSFTTSTPSGDKVEITVVRKGFDED